MLLRKEPKKYLRRKNNMKFEKNEDAVSPVIGVILMVAITVILAAVIAAFVFNLGGSQEKAPTASIVAANNPEGGYDMKITHKGGDLLKAGDYKLSVVNASDGSAPSFVASTSTSGDFSVGQQIAVNRTTSGCAPGTCELNSSSLNVTIPANNFATVTKYDVKLVHIPSNAMLVDTVVEVR
jgi:flagellin-like protein